MIRFREHFEAVICGFNLYAVVTTGLFSHLYFGMNRWLPGGAFGILAIVFWSNAMLCVDRAARWRRYRLPTGVE